MKESKEIYINETERKPNLYASHVLSGVAGVIAFVCAMNELGVFQVSRIFVYECLGMSLILYVIMRLIVKNPARLINPSSKYIMMSMVLLLVLTLTVILNIHAVLAFVLPLLLATQYRSRRVSQLALAGACLCCGLAPILSYLFGTWSVTFLTGYIQTFCRVTVNISPGNSMSLWDAVWQITLYWSLPQMLTLCAFGVILFSVTKSGVDSVQNQMQVSDLSRDLSRQLASIQSMQKKVLYAMSDIIESRDIETGGHVRRTSEIVSLLMQTMMDDPKSSVSETFCNNVINSAPMHDLGKIAVPDTILKKPGPLTDAEYEIVKEHPLKSAEIIAQALTGIEDENLLETAQNIALYHHERYDGTGYPKRLKGKEIPLEARIMAIADVYDALVNERCYKAPMAFDEAFRTIEASMGTQFDPELNPYFLSCRREIEGFYQNQRE